MQALDVRALEGANLNQFPALVLNADYRPLEILPLSTWTWEDTIHAVIKDRVSVVAEYDRTIRSPSVEFRLPSVIALREFVHCREHLSIGRHELLVLRDKQACAYCGHKFSVHNLSFDHVIPTSRGGKHAWENIVSACKPCNQKKDDRLLEEAGMKLLWRPWKPTLEELARAEYFLNERRMHESWKPYLPFLQ